MSLTDFITRLGENPILLVSSLLIFGVILVNGWTDAPNAIATCVSTRAIGAPQSHYYGGGIQLFGRVYYDCA